MLIMSIEVLVSTSISPLRTCIKVLSEHIVCRQSIIILNMSFVSLSLSILFLWAFCHCPLEPVEFCLSSTL